MDMTDVTRNTKHQSLGEMKVQSTTSAPLVAINENKNETLHIMRATTTTILVLLFFLNNISGQNGDSNLK